jgi:hypothetical protein
MVVTSLCGRIKKIAYSTEKASNMALVCPCVKTKCVTFSAKNKTRTSANAKDSELWHDGKKMINLAVSDQPFEEEIHEVYAYKLRISKRDLEALAAVIKKARRFIKN